MTTIYGIGNIQNKGSLPCVNLPESQYITLTKNLRYLQFYEVRHSCDIMRKSGQGTIPNSAHQRQIVVHSGIYDGIFLKHNAMYRND